MEVTLFRQILSVDITSKMNSKAIIDRTIKRRIASDCRTLFDLFFRPVRFDFLPYNLIAIPHFTCARTFSYLWHRFLISDRIQQPTGPELVHILFNPLSYTVDASLNASRSGENVAAKVKDPPLTVEAKKMLQRTLTPLEKRVS